MFSDSSAALCLTSAHGIFHMSCMTKNYECHFLQDEYAELVRLLAEKEARKRARDEARGVLAKVKKVKMVITSKSSWTLISPQDQKRLLLLEKSHPTF